jgi:hypothetical protein
MTASSFNIESCFWKNRRKIETINLPQHLAHVHWTQSSANSSAESCAQSSGLLCGRMSASFSGRIGGRSILSIFRNILRMFIGLDLPRILPLILRPIFRTKKIFIMRLFLRKSHKLQSGLPRVDRLVRTWRSEHDRRNGGSITLRQTDLTEK